MLRHSLSSPVPPQSKKIHAKALGILGFVAAVMTAPVLLGCMKITANAGGRVAKRAAPAMEQHWDHGIAGQAMPGNIIQTEGLLRLSPENETLITNAIRLYTGYAYGWVEDHAEELRLEGRHLEAEEEMRRARYMYLRALDLAKHLIALDHEGFDEHMEEGLESFESWLQDEFDEDDVAGLFFAGFSWGSYINANKSNMEAVSNLPFARALIERAMELDPSYYNYGGLIFNAVMNTSAPNADISQARPHWERAIEATERRNLLVLVNMARSYATRIGDRELFVSLLREVLEAGDVNPDQRLQNVIARRRAARSLQQIDTLIPEDGEPPAEVMDPAPAETVSAEEAAVEAP